MSWMKTFSAGTMNTRITGWSDKRKEIKMMNLLKKNLAFLLKKYNLKMGDLEKILGISAGYISRTAKENSTKKAASLMWHES